MGPISPANEKRGALEPGRSILSFLVGAENAYLASLERVWEELNEDLPVRELGTHEGSLPLFLLDGSQIPERPRQSGKAAWRKGTKAKI